jgi:hypothetical protein
MPVRSNRSNAANHLREHPHIVGVRTDWQDEDDSWKAYADNDAVWEGIPTRWVCLLAPDDFSQVTLIRFLKRPHDQIDAPWAEFARAEGGKSWAIAHPGVGLWDISAEVLFADGTTRTLHKSGN